MKIAIVLPDGASDEKLPVLDNRTPCDVARTPHLDWIASHGQLGHLVSVPEGFTAGTDVGTLSVLGYDPHRYYSGRAPIEAAAKGLPVRPDQLIFRCNFVTIEDGRMQDFTAGHIAQSDANALIAALNGALKNQGCEFHAGVSYRNLMLLGDAADFRLKTQPPHDIPDQPTDPHWPRGKGEECVRHVMQTAAELLRDHPVNAQRAATGHHRATNIWLWGQGKPVPFETFQQRHGITGACITAVDIIRGFAKLLGLELIEVPGATGYIDTNYAGKGKAAVQALDRHDLVVVHVEAADEAGHLGDAAEKVKALERIDQDVVGPILDKLRTFDQWRILVAADHPTPCSTKAHSAVPPHFAYAGSGVSSNGGKRYTEEDATRVGLFVERGHELMATFLAR